MLIFPSGTIALFLNAHEIGNLFLTNSLVFGIFAALAEFEAALIRERTQAGLTAARARGRVGGRPRKMTTTALTMAMTALAEPRNAAKEVAQRLGITTTTLYTYVNGDGSPKAAGQHLLDAARAAEPHAGRPGRARHVSP
jgi:DNA invertase Pin-like site-specific DNA recombinase